MMNPAMLSPVRSPMGSTALPQPPQPAALPRQGAMPQPGPQIDPLDLQSILAAYGPDALSPLQMGIYDRLYAGRGGENEARGIAQYLAQQGAP